MVHILTEKDVQNHFRKVLRAYLGKSLKEGERDVHYNSWYWYGCSIPELRSHLEKQFKEGMSWGNWRGTLWKNCVSKVGSMPERYWECDHIKGLAFFDLRDKKQVAEAAHFTNLQPLWKEEHCKKSAAERVLLLAQEKKKKQEHEERVALAIKMHYAGNTDKEIAEFFGKTEEAVFALLESKGVYGMSLNATECPTAHANAKHELSST